jgi:hypothetical protein
MKKQQQINLVYIIFGPFMAIMIGSSVIATKYPEYINYVCAGLMVVAVLMYALAFYLMRNTEP